MFTGTWFELWLGNLSRDDGWSNFASSTGIGGMFRKQPHGTRRKQRTQEELAAHRHSTKADIPK